LNDTTDLVQDASAPQPAASTPRTRRRATSGGLSAMVLPELQALAGELGITGVGRLRKSQLIDAIRERQGGGAEPSTGPGTAAPSVGEEPAGARAAAPTSASRSRSRTSGAAQSQASGPGAPAASGPAADSQGDDRARADRPSADTDRTDGPRPETDRDEQAADGEQRPERVDRGRERFLEREARRAERAAAAAAAGEPDAVAGSESPPGRRDDQ
jgi:transcription termination factor Rho